MIKKLAYLAVQNIKKNRKYFFIITSVILFLSVYYNTLYIYQDSLNIANKEYRIQEYGEWYIQADIVEGDKEHRKVAQLKDTFETVYKPKEQYQNFQYCFVYRQNEYMNEKAGFDKIGYFQQDYMNMCHVELIAGIMPNESNTIAVSTKYKKEHHVDIQEEVLIYINNQLQKCKIVGIYQNSQEDMIDVCVSQKDAVKDYPVIYTNSTLIYSSQIDNKKMESTTSIWLDEIQNPFGYDQNKVMNSIQLSYEQVITLCNALFITSVLLICLNKTSYRKRTHELALYRAIGMTTYQLIFLMICEMFFIAALSILVGVILSLLVSYMMMLYMETQIECFAYVVNIKQLMINCLILLSTIIVVNLIPIYQSVNIALSGSFGAKKFSYFEVRQKSFKLINGIKFAVKELTGNYVVMICLVLFLSYFSSMAVVNQFGREPEVKGQPHYIIHVKSNEKLPSVLLDTKFEIEKYRVKEATIQLSLLSQQSKINKIISIDNEALFEKHLTSSIENNKIIELIDSWYVYIPDHMKYHFPLKDGPRDHAMLSDKYKVVMQPLSMMDENGNTITKESECLESEGTTELSLIVDEDSEYSVYIKGFLNKNIIYRNDFPIETVYPFPSDAIYMNNKAFGSYFEDYDYEEAFVFLNNKQEVDSYLEELYNYNDIEVNYIDEFEVYEDAVNQFDKLFIPPNVIYAVMIMTFIILMYMNLSEIEAHKHDYFLQRILGMTQFDIIKKQFMKVGILFMTMAGLSYVFTQMQSSYYMQQFQLKSFIILLMIQFIILVFDFIVPMIYVLSDKNLMKIEERE